MTSNGISSNHGDSIETEHLKIMERASATIMKREADKLIEQSAANISAAEEALRFLKDSHEALATEVRQLADAHANRLTEYLQTVHLATTAMAKHRETMMQVAQSIASTGMPVTPTPEMPELTQEHAANEQGH